MNYTGLQGRVYRMLKEVPWTRERRDKSRAIVRLLTDRGTKFPQTEQELKDFIDDASSADRYWRLLTAEHEDLRGTDYDTKQIVEQRFEIEQLGLEPGHHQRSKQLELITA